MSLAQSIYSGAREVVKNSEKEAQYATAAMAGAAIAGGWGAGSGLISDRSTVTGGAVGGASFGAMTGAAAAFALHQSSASRDFIGQLLEKNEARVIGAANRFGGAAKQESGNDLGASVDRLAEVAKKYSNNNGA